VTRTHTDGIRIANPDPDREPREQPPQVTVESREHMGSMLELDPSQLDKAFKYRWVNVAPLKVSRAKAKGYRFVDPDEGIVNAVGDSPDTEDGRVRVGDVVLMKCPRTVYRERRSRVATRTKTRLGVQKRKFKREAEARGIERYGQAVEVITDKEPAGSKE
jgi:hypothetical protein